MASSSNPNTDGKNDEQPKWKDIYEDIPSRHLDTRPLEEMEEEYEEEEMEDVEEEYEEEEEQDVILISSSDEGAEHEVIVVSSDDEDVDYPPRWMTMTEAEREPERERARIRRLRKANLAANNVGTSS